MFGSWQGGCAHVGTNAASRASFPPVSMALVAPNKLLLERSDVRLHLRQGRHCCQVLGVDEGLPRRPGDITISHNLLRI